jgi:GrpB-like predicted nucleotidyltransferase (UPF0157 family)
MKIRLKTYAPGWTTRFESIRSGLPDRIGFMDPAIEHIGNTSVE